MFFKNIKLKRAIMLWKNGSFERSLELLKRLVNNGHKRSYVHYLRRIWGNGSLYDEYCRVMEIAKREEVLDCIYFDLWKTFSNRPDDDEFINGIKELAAKGQKNALLSIGIIQWNNDERLVGIKNIIRSYPCRMSRENISMIWHYGDQSDVKVIESMIDMETLTDIIFTYSDVVPLEPMPIPKQCPQDGLLNDKMSNDEFNATVFTTKRKIERKRISQGLGKRYSQIKDEFSSFDWKSLGIYLMDGLTKNSWMLDSEDSDNSKERHSIYLMKKVDDGWMTLRIADHTSNLQDYYKYRRMFVPSKRPYANMSIIFHGDEEQNASLKYSFKFCQDTADPCVTVRDEDFQAYRPFPYTFAHYVPGLIDDLRILDSVIGWFAGNGDEPFLNPYVNCDENPCARIQRGWVTIETWDIKYARRAKQRK